MSRDDFPHRFRMKLWPLLLFGAVAVPAGTAVAIAARGWAAGADPFTRAYLLAVVRGGWPNLVVAAALAPALYALVVWWFRVGVGPAGLRGFDFWGRYLTLPWDAEVRLRPTAFFGLPFLRVQSAGRRTVWLPRFLHDPDGFADALGRFAGPDHPLTAAARDRLAPD